jgi:hypothetical protein
MAIGSIATLAISIFATDGSTSYTPNPIAWFYTLIVPIFLILVITSYYNEKEPY